MVQINHWVTKRVEKGSLRIFFALVNDSSLLMRGSIFLELRWLFGAVYNVEIPLEKVINSSAFFYIDVPEATGKKWKSFEWVWVDGEKRYQGKGKKVDKFEDLV